MATQSIDLLKNSSFEDKLDAVVEAITASSPADGFSPVISVGPKVDGEVEITIQDKLGISTVTLRDGENGQGGDMFKNKFATQRPDEGYVDAAVNATMLNGKAASFYAPNLEMEGATTTSDGETGLVPAPLRADRNKFLKGDGTWADVVGTSGALEVLSVTIPANLANTPVFVSSYFKSDETTPVAFRLYSSLKDHHWETYSVNGTSGTLTVAFPSVDSQAVTYICEIYELKVS